MQGPLRDAPESGAGRSPGRDTVPYGKTITVDTGLGRLSIDTGKLPVDPSA
ncbi:hypothetical protein ACWGJT_09155 [Streptomyces xantholiticus]